MDALLIIVVFVALEVALLLGLFVGLLARRQKRLKTRLQAFEAAQSDPAEEKFASMESGYLPYLEQQLAQTREQLEQGADAADDDQAQQAALHRRMELLQAEKALTEHCNDYPEQRWAQVATLYAVAAAQPDTNPGADTVDASQAGDDPLAQAHARIAGLEKFRDNFFQLRNELKALALDKDALAEQLAQLLPEAERSAELQALLSRLNEQNARLNSELEQLEAQASRQEQGDAIVPAVGAEVDEAAAGELHSALGRQGEVIEAIKGTLAQAGDAPSAELVADLSRQVKTLEQRYREATTCLDVMGQENERLQEKVERKDAHIAHAETESRENVSDLQDQLGKQKQKLSELTDLLGTLQLEAEQAETLRAKFEQLELAGRDMNMCIQILEEENQFLQEQVRALLQLDEGESVYTAEQAAAEADGASLQAELEALQSKLADKDAELGALAEKYAAMEQEYLTLYEELHA